MIERAVILAAGLGLRLKPLTNGAPKCLTEVNGTPILFNTLRNLSSLGIAECTLVVGYRSSAIRKTVGSSFGGVQIRYIENDAYRSTNDIYSLWLARGVVEQGAIILEGDIFSGSKTLTTALNRAEGNSCYLAGGYDGSSHEVLIMTDDHLRILSVEVLHERSARRGSRRYMSSGMLILQQDYGRCFSRWLSRFVHAGRVDVLFDQVIAEHAGDEPLYVAPIEHGEWVEIDTPDDLSRAERMFR